MGINVKFTSGQWAAWGGGQGTRTPYILKAGDTISNVVPPLQILNPHLDQKRSEIMHIQLVKIQFS